MTLVFLNAFLFESSVFNSLFSFIQVTGVCGRPGVPALEPVAQEEGVTEHALARAGPRAKDPPNTWKCATFRSVQVLKTSATELNLGRARFQQHAHTHNYIYTYTYTYTHSYIHT